MKKLLVVALALFTLNGMAQEKDQTSHRKDRSELRKDMTPNDIADLKSKKLTLKLDLTDAQQKKVHAIFLKEAKANETLKQKHKTSKGEKREKPSKEEFLKMQNARLDQQIEIKREMKTILNKEQYAKFEQMKPRKDKKRGEGNKRRSKYDDKK